MKTYQLKCPSCGADIVLEGNRSFCFCTYCGARVYIDNGTHKVEITKNINHNKTYRDEAKIRKIEFEERMQERILLEQQKERRRKRWSAVGTFIVVIACIIGFFYIYNSWGNFFDSEKENSDLQEQELQAIVDDVLQDIENGNFEEAYIKAEKIRYTENWSDEITEKWDATREETIEQIKKAEREVNKTTWWNPFD